MVKNSGVACSIWHYITWHLLSLFVWDPSTNIYMAKRNALSWGDEESDGRCQDHSIRCKTSTVASRLCFRAAEWWCNASQSLKKKKLNAVLQLYFCKESRPSLWWAVMEFSCSMRIENALLARLAFVPLPTACRMPCLRATLGQMDGGHPRQGRRFSWIWKKGLLCTGQQISMHFIGSGPTFLFNKQSQDWCMFNAAHGCTFKPRLGTGPPLHS